MSMNFFVASLRTACARSFNPSTAVNGHVSFGAFHRFRWLRVPFTAVTWARWLISAMTRLSWLLVSDHSKVSTFPGPFFSLSALTAAS